MAGGLATLCVCCGVDPVVEDSRICARCHELDCLHSRHGVCRRRDVDHELFGGDDRPSTVTPLMPKRKGSHLPKQGGNRRVFDYVCTGCGKTTARDKLLVKKVNFREMGRNGQLVKGRSIGWFCPVCIKKDPDWNIPEGFSPGEPKWKEMES